MIAGAYTTWMMRYPNASERLRSFDRVVHYGLLGALGVGVLFVAQWPVTMAIAAFALAIVACTAWAVVDYTVRHHVERPGALATPPPVSTDEPEFWAEALLEPAPQPTPSEPPPPEPVPSDPTPRAVPKKRRTAPARARQPGTRAPRTGTTPRTRRRTRV